MVDNKRPVELLLEQDADQGISVKALIKVQQRGREDPVRNIWQGGKGKRRGRWQASEGGCSLIRISQRARG